MTFDGKICVICGANAHGMHFNALTCISCKLFFRRTALINIQELTCAFVNKCQINTITRKFCTKCRLQKCFDMGMDKNKISSHNVKRKIMEKLIRKRQKLDQTTTNQLNEESSSSNEDNFDRFSLTTSLDEYCDEILSRDNISSSIESLFDFESEFELELQTNPINLDSLSTRELINSEKRQLQEVTEACSVLQNPYRLIRNVAHCNEVHPSSITEYFFHRLIQMCKRLSRFSALPSADQMQMLKCNLIDVFSLRTVQMYVPDRESWCFVDDKCKVGVLVNWESLRPICGTRFEENKTYYQNLMNQFRHEWLHDHIIFDLITVIVLFTPRFTFNQYDRIKEDNLRYKSLLRRYLEVIYPTFTEADECYRKLMSNIDHILEQTRNISFFLQSDMKMSSKDSPLFSQILASCQALYNPICY